MLKYRIQHVFALLLWLAIGVSIPGYVVWHYGATLNPLQLGGVAIPVDILRALAIISMLVFTAMGTAKCSPIYPLIGVVSAGFIGYVGIPYTLQFNSVWWVLILLIASFIGAIAGGLAFYLTAPAQFKMSKEDHHAKNPTCKTCYAKSFCAWQPGAAFDQYKDKKIIPIQSKQEQLPEPVKAAAFVYKPTLNAEIESDFERLLMQIKRGIPYRWNNPWITQRKLVDISGYDQRIVEASEKAKFLLKEIKAELISQGAIKNNTLVHSTISSAIHSAIYNNYGLAWDIDFKFLAFYSYVLWILFISSILSFPIPAMLGVEYLVIPIALLGSFASLLFSNGQKRDIIRIMIAIPAFILVAISFRI